MAVWRAESATFTIARPAGARDRKTARLSVPECRSIYPSSARRSTSRTTVECARPSSRASVSIVTAGRWLNRVSAKIVVSCNPVSVETASRIRSIIASESAPRRLSSRCFSIRSPLLYICIVHRYIHRINLPIIRTCLKASGFMRAPRSLDTDMVWIKMDALLTISTIAPWSSHFFRSGPLRWAPLRPV